MSEKKLKLSQNYEIKLSLSMFYQVKGVSIDNPKIGDVESFAPTLTVSFMNGKKIANFIDFDFQEFINIQRKRIKKETVLELATLENYKKMVDILNEEIKNLEQRLSKDNN